MSSSQLYPYPQGWYCITPSRELRAGQARPLTFAGEEYVLYRTENGEAVALTAFCPHLGAHMGKGGKVRGDAIECPFHSFQFDPSGDCVATGYGSKPPNRCSVDRLHIIERDGLVLAWHCPLGSAPSWHVEELEEGDWLPPMFHTVELDSHPQETSENSVDLGHLSIVHGYGEVLETEPVELKGPWLTTRYAMTRKNPFGVGPGEVSVNFRARVNGLGVSIVKINVQPFDFNIRLFILPTPTSEGRIKLRAALSLQRWSALRWMPRVGIFDPAKLIELLTQRIAIQGAAHDVSQDFEIWENKIYVSEPRLARGDGPIGRYRLWCRQFYPETLARKAESRAVSAAE